jgi:hypothetical protein
LIAATFGLSRIQFRHAANQSIFAPVFAFCDQSRIFSASLLMTGGGQP